MTTEEAVLECWRDLRDDLRRKPYVVAVVNFAYDIDLLTLEQRELWLRRLDTCPGHDGDGRAWCAYCGNIPRPEEIRP